MSDETMKRSGTTKKGSSGDHPIMKAVREKLASIREGQLPELEALNARIDKLREDSPPPNEEEIARPIKESCDKLPEKVDEEGDTLPGMTVSVPHQPESEKKDGKS